MIMINFLNIQGQYSEVGVNFYRVGLSVTLSTFLYSNAEIVKYSIVVSALKEVGLHGLSPTLAVFIERLGCGNLKTGLMTRSTLKLKCYSIPDVQRTYLVEKPHHLHEAGRVALLACDALDLGFNPLQEVV
jgi:hypothetical protein